MHEAETKEGGIIYQMVRVSVMMVQTWILMICDFVYEDSNVEETSVEYEY